MINIYRKLIEMAMAHGKGKLIIFGIVIIAISLLGIIATLTVAPLMQIALGVNTSVTIPVIGKSLNFDEVAWFFIIGQLSLCVGNVLAEWLRSKFIADYGAWLRVFMLSKVMKRPYTYFTSRNSSVIQQTVNGYASTIGSLTGQALELLSKVIIVMGFVMVAVMMNPLLSISMAMVTVVYYVILLLFFAPLRKRVSTAMSDAAERLQSYSIQTIQGVKFLRISQKQSIYVEKYEDEARKFARNSVIPSLLAMVPKYVMECLLMLGLVTFMLFLHKGDQLLEALPQVSVIVFVAFKVMPLSQGIYSLYNGLSTSAFILEKVYEEFKSCDVEEQSDERIEFNNQISLENLTFSYAADSDAINFPSFSIHKGKTIGIKGPSGSGKSTLLDLLLGLYKSTSGSILVDGKEASPMQLRSLYDRIGYVGQDPYLLDMSVAENIALSHKGDVDVKKLHKAASLAQIHEHVLALPGGYDTVVGDRGVRLSGGQRQRISIARALYDDPNILLLDEATSALDDETESRLMDTIYSLPDDITIVMIAHRLTTLKRADNVIDLGKVLKAV